MHYLIFIIHPVVHKNNTAKVRSQVHEYEYYHCRFPYMSNVSTILIPTVDRKSNLISVYNIVPIDIGKYMACTFFTVDK